VAGSAHIPLAATTSGRASRPDHRGGVPAAWLTPARFGPDDVRNFDASAFESSMSESGGAGWSGSAGHTTLAFGLMCFCILALARFAMRERAKTVAHANTRAQLPR
jgi:hypothetical protein